jgi:type IV pilus assembly protein PilE
MQGIKSGPRRAVSAHALPNAGGFTLIELMIVVIIVAVLLTVGLPAYQDQIIRGHRAAAKGEMLEIANRQQQYLLSNRTYTNNASNFSYNLSADVSPHYTFSISTQSSSGVPAFEITFSPQGRQAVDGDLTLDSEGKKSPADKWSR